MLKDKIKLLMDLIKDSEINQIEVSSFWGAQKIKLSKDTNFNTKIENPNAQYNSTFIDPQDEATKPDDVSANSNKQPDSENQETKNLSTFNAPLVGTFYLAPNPDSEPFVKVGDKIKIGDTICIIEAMKIFNEIKIEESINSGEIVEILVDDNTPIEYNQPLFKIKTS
tara:strand:+ start:391 stop:894 length:504 start_codon:yes stop_codon:yes gene_type:complete